EVCSGAKVVSEAARHQSKMEVAAMEVAIIFRTSRVEIFDSSLMTINAPGFAIHWPRIVSREVPQFQTLPKGSDPSLRQFCNPRIGVPRGLTHSNTTERAGLIGQIPVSFSRAIKSAEGEP